MTRFNSLIRMNGCCPSSVVALLTFLAGFGLAPSLPAQPNTNVLVVAFTTASSTPLSPRFAGFTTEILGTGVEYADTNLQRVAAALSPGWLLFPAGVTGDTFNWSNGLK